MTLVRILENRDLSTFYPLEICSEVKLFRFHLYDGVVPALNGSRLRCEDK